MRQRLDFGVARWVFLGAAVLGLLLPSRSAADTFLRGDSNGDGILDISDPIFTLGYLFLGQPPPAKIGCLDALDTNDDGMTDISDGIYALSFLFLGTAAPPPPFPQPGVDLTADDLDCGVADALPNFTGLWSGTFDDGEDLFVVVLEVEDDGSAALVLAGMESLGNEITGGELYLLVPPAGPYRFALVYTTFFDTVTFISEPSRDGNKLGGEWISSMGSGGCGSLVRVTAPLAVSAAAGAYRMTFVDEDSGALDPQDDDCDDLMWGGYVAFNAAGEATAALIAGTPGVESGGVAVSPQPSGKTAVLRDVCEAQLVTARGDKIHLVGLRAEDTGIIAGWYEDAWTRNGKFIFEPIEPGEWTP